jgi:hypothetical protein
MRSLSIVVLTAVFVAVCACAPFHSVPGDHGTVIFAGQSLVGGSLLTKRLCDEIGKPCLVLSFPAANDQHKLLTD